MFSSRRSSVSSLSISPFSSPSTSAYNSPNDTPATTARDSVVSLGENTRRVRKSSAFTMDYDTTVKVLADTRDKLADTQQVCKLQFSILHSDIN